MFNNYFLKFKKEFSNLHQAKISKFIAFLKMPKAVTGWEIFGGENHILIIILIDE